MSRCRIAVAVALLLIADAIWLAAELSPGVRSFLRSVVVRGNPAGWTAVGWAGVFAALSFGLLAVRVAPALIAGVEVATRPRKRKLDAAPRRHVEDRVSDTDRAILDSRRRRGR